MPAERVVNNGQQISKNRGPLAEFAHKFTNPTIRSYGPDLPTNYTKAKEIPGATGDKRTLLLDQASQILTQPEPLTAGDMVRFTDVMLQVSGSYEIGNSESITSVPDRIPRTGVKEITIQQEVSNKGVSVNVVYQTVGDRQDQRFVIGDNFGESIAMDSTNTLQVGKTETPVMGIKEKDPKQSAIRLDASDSDQTILEQQRRQVCTDIYVAHLANTGAIERSRDAAETVRELIHHGTPVTKLGSSK